MPVDWKRRPPRVAVLFAFAVGLLIAAPARAAVFNPQTFELANGMQVVVVPNHRAPIVIHMVWYRVGAADEPAGKSGIAHFLEHLMFKGTDTVPAGEFSKIVARNGGQDNAFTSQDYTAYFQRVARDKLELVMRLESDRMANLTLTDEEVLPERDVVLEERRSRTGNNPTAQLREASDATLYLNHPYGGPVIGWNQEISELTTEDALAFYREHYVPNNAILIVAGDITAAELKPLAEKYYGRIPAREIEPRQRLEEPEHQASRRVVLRSERVQQPAWGRTYLAPSYNWGETEHAYALQVLSEIMGGGATSRLYRALVVEKGVAAAAGSWYSADNLDMGEFGVYATPMVGGDVATVEKAMEEQIDRLLRDGVTADEVAKAKHTMLASAIYARDSLSAAPNIFGRALTTGSTVEDVEAWPDRIETVTVEQVNAAAEAVFQMRNSVTSVLLPATTD